MKKKILSFMLVLVMVFGVITPVTVSAAEVDKRQLFEEIKNRIPEEINIGALRNIFNTLARNKERIFNELPEKEYLQINGINEGLIDQFIDAVLNSSELILDLILDSDLTYENAKDDIETLLESFYSLLPNDVKESITYYAPNEQEKLNIMARVINASLDKKIGKGDYNKSTGKWTSLDLMIDEELIRKINKEISDDDDKPLDDRHLNIANKFFEEAVKVLSPDLIDKAGKILYDLDLIDKNEITPTPVPGGGGGGGGAPSTPTEPEVEVPEGDGPATVVVGEEVSEIEKKDETTIIKVRESEIIKAIEALKDAAGDDREALVVLNLDTVKGFDYNIELSDKLIEALVKSKVSIEINTGDTEIILPVSVLEEISLPSDSKLEFRIAEISGDDVNEAVPETGEIKKGVDLSLVLVKADKETVITNFKTYVTVRIDVEGLGDKDKLAVYYLNEETNTLEFVTGKIVDNKVQLKLSHFSKYVIIESKLTFEDLLTHWSRKYVESMAAKNVINGYGDGTFRPHKEITRAEFAKMIVKALELDIIKYNGEFSDIKATDWYADYVATIVEAGLAKGYGDSTFRPNNNIIRAEMAVILGNVLDVKVKPDEIDSLLNRFADLENLQDWAKLGVSKVIKDGIMIGSDNLFNPGGTATRAEVATAIYRLYNR